MNDASKPRFALDQREFDAHLLELAREAGHQSIEAQRDYTARLSLDDLYLARAWFRIASDDDYGRLSGARNRWMHRAHRTPRVRMTLSTIPRIGKAPHCSPGFWAKHCANCPPRTGCCCSCTTSNA